MKNRSVAKPFTANPEDLGADLIREAYYEAERALGRVGKLLRTTQAGHRLWSSQHKTAVSGLRVVIDTLARDVPYYAAMAAEARANNPETK